MKKTFIIWLPFLALSTIICATIVLVIQQDIRQSAYDPQIQMAEDFVSLPASTTPIDISTSLAPYFIVFDAQGKPIASTGVLNGNIPTIPQGIFNYLQSHTEDRFTWQPQEGVRSAVVVTHTKNQSGYVLAGRSLRESENRAMRATDNVTIAWIFSLITTFIFCYFVAQNL